MNTPDFRGARVRYELRPSETGVRVAEIDLADGGADPDEDAMFRHEAVAVAYAAAFAALDRHFARLHAGLDSREEFEIWRGLDDRYEEMVTIWRDAPRYGVKAPIAPARARPASISLH